MNPVFRILGVAFLLMGVFATTATATSDVIQRYSPGVGDVGIICDAAGVVKNVGGACFDVSSWAAMGIILTDDHVQHVGAFIQFTNAAGKAVAQGEICDDIALRLPLGAVTLSVAMEGFTGVIGCGAQPATSGTIEAFEAIYVG